MTAPITTTQPGSSLQRERRGWTDEYTDQHGRRFAATYDLGNTRPIGELAPVDFAPPWLPPMRFIAWDRPGGFRFHWDYASMAAELSEGSDQFYTEVVQFMLEHMPNEPVPEVGEPIPARVRRFVGKPPLSPAIPLAAEAGDPWILGSPGATDTLLLKDVLAQTVNANGREALQLIRDRTKQRLSGVATVATTVAEPVPVTKAKTINSIDTQTIAQTTYNEFVAEGRKAGLSMAELSQAWATHKANLAAEAA